ncbi:hypothetical protein QYE76_014520 [Lolium multiflorum]|uniref:Dof zinc finger protein n=1 Tax=Lolium multiflorum TaxID=4521 RepID=A0AAD8U4P7_LOLMU|nr:hypothetical protein QYE76_014520 [Lolium multiflorum]
MLAYAAAAAGRRAALIDPRRYRPNVEVAPSCPRCDSPNTKFCYYNNYSLSQPRYFCKGCRRYWTKGGSLRNVPVGGGCRKNRRGKPVRSTTEIVSANHDAAAFSPRFHGPVIRPDLLLEGMTGSPPEPGHQPASSGNEKPAGVADGSTIDMSLLYSRFLSHQPLGEKCAVVPESVDTFSGSCTDEVSPPALSDPSQHGFGELCGPVSCTEPSSATTMLQCADAARAQELSEYNNFSVDQSCYDSLGLPTDGGDLVLPSTWGQEAKYEPFDSLPEDAMGLHAGDDVWSKVLGCQGLEAALCRP